MSGDEANALAMKFVEQERMDHARRHGVEPFEYTSLGADLDSSDKSKWCVCFLVKTPEGSPLDGPVFVLIDDATGRAEFFG